MLLGLVLNYGILAPRLIEDKIIRHPPPKITAVAAPKLPLAVKAGQTFTVQLEEAVTRPELPSPDELKANPELSSAVSTRVLRYTWTRPTVYSELADLDRDLNAETLQDGSPNPLYGALSDEHDGAVTKQGRKGRGSHRSAGGHRLGSRSSPSRRTSRGHPGRPGIQLCRRTSRQHGRERWAFKQDRRGIAEDRRRLPQHQCTGRSGRGPRCWWSAGCWRWPSNGGPWGGPSPASSPASAAIAMRPRARWITSKFP